MRGMSATTTLNYWARNVDNLLVGRVLGTTALGLYSRAYSLMMLPVTQVAWTLTRVMQPRLARVRHDVPAMHEAYVRAVSVIMFMSAPCGPGHARRRRHGRAPAARVRVAAMVPALQLLCVGAVAQALLSTVSWLYVVGHETDALARVTLGTSAVALSGSWADCRSASRVSRAASRSLHGPIFRSCWSGPPSGGTAGAGHVGGSTSRGRPRQLDGSGRGAGADG